eukprot:RCo045728
MVAFEYSFLYHYPWEVLVEAYMKRYPTCEHFKCLISSTVEEQEESEGGARQRVVRRIKIAPDAPRWLSRLTGIWAMDFLQTVTIDRTTRALTMTSVNDFLKTRVDVLETASYQAYEANPQWTIFSCSGTVTLRNLYRTEGICERIAMWQYLKNGRAARQVDCIFINQVLQEHPERWPGLKPWDDYDERKPGLNQPLNSLESCTAPPSSGGVSAGPPGIDPKLYSSLFTAALPDSPTTAQPPEGVAPVTPSSTAGSPTEPQAFSSASQPSGSAPLVTATETSSSPIDRPAEDVDPTGGPVVRSNADA